MPDTNNIYDTLERKLIRELWQKQREELRNIKHDLYVAKERLVKEKTTLVYSHYQTIEKKIEFWETRQISLSASIEALYCAMELCIDAVDLREKQKKEENK